MVICLERGADCLHMVQLMPLHPKTPQYLASFRSRLALPFSYRLIQVVLEKRPLNGCSSGSSQFSKYVTFCLCSVHLLASLINVVVLGIFVSADLTFDVTAVYVQTQGFK